MVNKKLIFDYINGEDIDNIDELENNHEFMMEVIKLTRDKNMLNMCSDEVKLNYEFVLCMIEIFKNDIQFIDEIASNYINAKGEEDVTSLELNFIMADILKRNADIEFSIKYNLIKSTFIASEKLKIRLAIETEEDLFWKQEFGLGFRVMQYEDYGNSRIIMNEMALEFIEDIFYRDADISLEELIHNQFKKVEDFKKVGAKKFILNYIRMYDTNLSDYLEAHTELLKDLEKNIHAIITRFDTYNRNLENRKDMIFEYDAKKIVEKHKESAPLNEYLRYIDKQNYKGLPKLSLYDVYDEDEEFDDYSVIDLNNLIDYKIIKELINLAKQVYLGKEKVENMDETVIKKKAKILNFDLIKKNVRKK